MRATSINDELFFDYRDVSMFLFGKVSWTQSYSVPRNHWVAVLAPSDRPALKRCSLISVAGIRLLCERTGKEHMLDALLAAETVDPLRPSVSDGNIENLRACAVEVLTAFFKSKGEEQLREAMKRLQNALGGGSL